MDLLKQYLTEKQNGKFGSGHLREVVAMRGLTVAKTIRACLAKKDQVVLICGFSIIIAINHLITEFHF